MKDYSQFVPNVHFEQIPIKNLVSNQDYQRSLSRQHIEKAARHYDVYQINPVKVSRRNGINYVFNGQHTIEIVALVSGTRETPVWCMIYDDLNYEHEADIFANQQKYVKPLSPFEIFNANIEAGSDDQLLIKSLVESYGCHITTSSGAYSGGNNICAVSTLETIYKKFGYQVLDRTLRLCVGTWEGEKASLSSKVLNPVAKLIVTYGDRLNDELFKEKIGNASLKQLLRTAKDRGGGSLCVAEVFVLEYNGKRKYPLLPIRDLYGKPTHSHTSKESEESIGELVMENTAFEDDDFDLS